MVLAGMQFSDLTTFQEPQHGHGRGPGPSGPTDRVWTLTLIDSDLGLSISYLH